MPAIKYAIFDLDNCLFDDRHRIPLIDWEKTDPDERYDRYHAAHGNDRPHHHDALLKHVNAGHTILVFTGRTEQHRATTLAQLRLHFPFATWHTNELFMRTRGYHAPAAELKRSMLNRALAGFASVLGDHEIVAAYDDRDDVVGMYDAEGIEGAEVLRIHNVDAYAPPPDLEGLVEPDPPRIRPRTKAPPLPEPSLVWPGVPHHPDMPPLPADIDIETALKAMSATLGEAQPWDAPRILEAAAATYRERNKVYGDNFRVIGRVMEALYPEGLSMRGERDFTTLHLWVLLLVKVTRFVNSDHTHLDSIHDLQVYGAMIEALLREGEKA